MSSTQDISPPNTDLTTAYLFLQFYFDVFYVLMPFGKCRPCVCPSSSNSTEVTCHHPEEMIYDLYEMIYHLAGMIYNLYEIVYHLAGMIYNLYGIIYHLAGMIYDLYGIVYHLAGMIYDLYEIVYHQEKKGK